MPLTPLGERVQVVLQEMEEKSKSVPPADEDPPAKGTWLDKLRARVRKEQQDKMRLP